MDRRLWAVLCAALLAGCGGSGSGTDNSANGGDDDGDGDGGSTVTVEGLDMPSNMSIVTAKDDSKAQTAAVNDDAGKRLINAYDDAGTDFSTDPVNTYVYDESMQALGTVNMILCLLEQTAASSMVNEGPYIAMVNEDDCEQGENQSGGNNGQSGGDQADQLNTWTIESTREDEDSPQIVRIWVPGQDPGEDCMDCQMDAQNILVEVTVNEGVDADNPFGDFSMNFKGVIDAGAVGGTEGTEMQTMGGTLFTADNEQDLPQYRFVELGGDALELGQDMGFSFEQAVNVIFDDADGNSGQAVTRSAETFDDGSGGQMSASRKFAVGFDQSNLLRGKDTNDDDLLDEQQCLSRDQYTTHAWRYNLYHRDDGTFNGEPVAEGQRVALNAGFSFTFDGNGDGSNNSYGWVGYHGVWSESGTLEDGQTVHKFDYQSDSTTEMTLNLSPGRMVRRSASEQPLSSFQGDEFEYHGEHPTLDNGGEPVYGDWLVTVNESDQFEVTHRIEWGEQGMVRSETVDHDDDPETPEVSVAGTFAPADGEWLWLWSDALGGDIVYVHDSAATTPAVTFYRQESVTPDDSVFDGGNVTLYCYERCPKGGLTQDDVDTAAGEMDLYYAYSGTPFQYTFSTAGGKLVLMDEASGQPVDASALDLASIGSEWGMDTGQMLTTPLNDPNKPWEAFDADVSYRWETGPNDWNRLVTVTDTADNLQSFDRPLSFAYTHSTANDANEDATYDGKTFVLDYEGPGDLWGFPSKQVGDTERWYPVVTLADGAELSDGDHTFVVKAIEKEQTMAELGDETECPALNISGTFSDPDLALPTASDIGTVGISLSDKPAVTDAPAVIEGELQE